MAGPFSSAEVVNTALELIASQSFITALNDGTPAAIAASVIYQPVVQLMMREIEPDFSRYTAALAIAVSPSQVPPWTYEYLYPSDCVRLRQVRPLAGTYDTNNPLPVRANVAFDIISSVNQKVILTNQINALAVYTSYTVPESLWDAVFADAVSRRLADPLAMALSGRPDFADKILEESARVAATAEAVDDSGFRRG
jgi:hypothetical protein